MTDPLNPYTLRLRREQILRLLDGHPVQVATGVGLFELVGVAPKPWQPLIKLPQVPSHIVAAHKRTDQRIPTEVWANDIYEVFKTPQDEGIFHLSIKRFDRAAVHNWRHLQQIKNEVCGNEFEAMELYPRESRLADNANQYHLWVAPEGADIPVGFPTGMVLIREDEVDMWNRSDHRGRQEPRQEGLTVGDTLDGARTPEVDAQIKYILQNPTGGGR